VTTGDKRSDGSQSVRLGDLRRCPTEAFERLELSSEDADGLAGLLVDQRSRRHPVNPLGAKGIGEAATIGSTPAVVNAVVDALRSFTVRHLDMPLRPERVWQAMHHGRA